MRKPKFFFEKSRIKQVTSKCILITGKFLIAYPVLCTIIFYVFVQDRYFYIWRIKHLSNNLGTLAEIAGIVAASLWIARKIFIEIKKRKMPNFQLPRHILLFLRRHHVLLGWIAFTATTAHGLYYLVRQAGNYYMLWTGWFAWGMLFLLSGLGIWFEYKLEAKKGKVKTIRLFHVGISILFFIGIYLHLYY